MKCMMCAKETDSLTKNKICKECDKIYFGAEEESSDFQIIQEGKLYSTNDSFNKASSESEAPIPISEKPKNFCSNCGQQIGSAKFCPYCGTENLELTMTNQTQQSDAQQPQQAVKQQQKPLKVIAGKSMRWFNFFVRFVIPIWLILGTFTYISQTNATVGEYFNGNIYDFYTDPMFGTINVIDLIMEIATFFILLCAILPLKSYQKTGYKIIIAYFVIRLLYPLLGFFIMDYLEINDISSYIGYSLPEVILSILNLVYFKKREHIFLN